MKILLVHQYFKFPEEGSGIRSWYIARSFASAGHEVTVLSGHELRDGEMEAPGFKVQYFKIPYDNSMGTRQRIVAFLQFVRSSRKYLRRHHDYDLGYVLTTPLTTGFIALHLKRKYRVPYVFEVGDLWPEVPIHLGFIRGSLLKKWLYGFEKKIYKNASLLAGLSPAIVEYIEYTLDFEKQATLLPNIADCNFFMPSALSVDKFSPDQPFVISYTGAIGFANQVDYIIDIAEKCLANTLPIQFHIMGNGAHHDQIVSRAQDLPNVIMHKSAGKDAVRKLLSMSHAAIISYRNENILTTGCPNKYMDALAAGKLIIINFRGWIKSEIEAAECGFSYPVDNPGSFHNVIQSFLDSPLTLAHFQQNARQLAEEKYDLPLFQQRLLKMIKEIEKDVLTATAF